LEDLPPDFAEKTVAAPAKLGNFHQLMDEYSRQILLAAIAECRGNRTCAARRLGLSRTQFYRRLGMYGLDSAIQAESV
jgi:transcriptional regulator of acetoin/glycerol metabolism